MKVRALLCALIVSAFVPGMTSTASAEERAAASARSPIRLAAPDQVVEGQRYKLTVRVGSRSIRRLEVQRQTTSIFGDKEWERVRLIRNPRPSAIRVGAVAGEADTDRFRVVATTDAGKSIRTKPAAVSVWHWFDIDGFNSYYSTAGVRDSGLFQFGMNGNQYRGWHAEGGYDMWEARYTPGRNCVALRGAFGVTDDSADGSSAQITITADDKPVYNSPTLTPGMEKRVTVPLNKPYRLGIQARDTSTEELWSEPAIGDAQLLCRGF
jgi:hypothetical protein